MTDFFIFFIGCIVGSFLNVVILRLPEDKPLTGRSHCPNCGHLLAPWELVPLMSFLVLRGKCRACKTKISPRYFIIEAVTGLLFLLGWAVLAPHSPASWIFFVEFLFISAVGLVTFVIDLEHYFIIGNLIFVSAAITLLINLVLDIAGHHSIWSIHGYFVTSVLGAAAGALPLFLTWAFPPRGQWMGFGDVELMFFLGAAARFPLVLIALLLAVFGGGFASVILLIFTKKNLKSRIPFGTLLVPATLLTMLWGPQILRWYLGLIGL